MGVRANAVRKQGYGSRMRLPYRYHPTTRRAGVGACPYVGERG